MVATTWERRSFLDQSPEIFLNKEANRYPDGQARQHWEPVVEEGERQYVISHAGLLQHRTSLRDVAHHVSKGVLLVPLIMALLALPVVMPVLAIGDYLLIWICLAHLFLVSVVLTTWAIAIAYLDVQRGEEAMEARPQTAADGDPSMGARTLPARPKQAV